MALSASALRRTSGVPVQPSLSLPAVWLTLRMHPSDDACSGKETIQDLAFTIIHLIGGYLHT